MSYGTPYSIQFVATNYVTPVANQVVEDLNRVQQGVINVNWGTQQMAGISSMGFHSLIFGVQMSAFYVSMLSSNMLRAESSSIAVDMAQQHLSDTIKRYGANSQEAVRATQSLERSQLMYQRQALVSNIMTASMGLQMVSMAATMYKYAIPALQSLVTWLHEATIATTVLEALSGPWGWAMLIGGAAVAVGAGVYLGTRPAAELPSTLTINSGNTEQVLEDYKRKLKRALTQSGVP